MSVSQKDSERLTVFIPPDINTFLRVEAAKQRKTISAVAIEAFQQYLKDQNKTEAVA